jgi:hypothetical protein
MAERDTAMARATRDLAAAEADLARLLHAATRVLPRLRLVARAGDRRAVARLQRLQQTLRRRLPAQRRRVARCRRAQRLASAQQQRRQALDLTAGDGALTGPR